MQHSLELLRFVCAVGIVWAHMHPTAGGLAVSPLTLFLLLMSSLAVGSLERAGRQEFLIRRVRRVAVPWLAWSAFYFVVNIVIDPGGLRGAMPDSPLSLLIGSTIHLWFLPFVVLLSVPIALAVPLVEDVASLRGLATVLVPLSVVGLYLHGNYALPDPMGHWSFASPSVAFGVLAALSRQHDTRSVPVAFVIVVAAFGLKVGSWVDVVQFGGAAIIFEIVCRVHTRHWLMLGLGRLSFGIYLAHPFFMLVYYKFVPAEQPEPVAVASVVLMSCVATFVILSMPGLRRLA